MDNTTIKLLKVPAALAWAVELMSPPETFSGVESLQAAAVVITRLQALSIGPSMELKLFGIDSASSDEDSRIPAGYTRPMVHREGL